MTMETYTVEITENDNNEGITADVYDADGLVTDSARVTYTDYGLTATRGEGQSDTIEREVTADVTTLNLQFSRENREFEFRLLGDREELLRERISDADWNLTRDEE